MDAFRILSQAADRYWLTAPITEFHLQEGMRPSQLHQITLAVLTLIGSSCDGICRSHAFRWPACAPEYHSLYSVSSYSAEILYAIASYKYPGVF